MLRSHGQVPRHIPREELLLLSVLVVLFVAFVILVVLLIGSERNRNTLLAEYEADRASSALFETYRESALNGNELTPAQGNAGRDDLPSNVKGFGVYGPQGEALRINGDAPESIASEIPRIEPQLFRFDKKTATIELWRMLGAMPGEPGGPPRPHGQSRGRVFGMMGMTVPHVPIPFGRGGPVPAYLYLKLNTQAFFANRNLLTLVLVLVPIALGAAMFVVWLFYLKNRRYRAKIESQKHLVHLGEIARTLSHEIKNPLSSIRLQTGIMKRVLAGETPRELTLIEEETDRLTQLVERIGEFLRDPIGKPETIDIASFLRELVGRFDWNVERMSVPEIPVYVQFDRERLRTVLENIMKNAAESGGQETPFSISLATTKQRVELRVTDRGVGVAEDLREKIFDPFYTTKVKGSGIGLAISKRFVESVSGTLDLENGKEGGTEATITLARVLADIESRDGE